MAMGRRGLGVESPAHPISGGFREMVVSPPRQKLEESLLLHRIFGSMRKMVMGRPILGRWWAWQGLRRKRFL